MKILTALVTFVIGLALAFLNYLLTKKLCSGNDSGNYPMVSTLRTAIGTVYLAALFMIGKRTGLDLTSLLIGGALGVTLPSVYFTTKLLKRTDVTAAVPEEDEEDDE